MEYDLRTGRISGETESTINRYESKAEPESIWNADDRQAAQKALQALAAIEALCGTVLGGRYVDVDILEEIVRDMEAKDGKSIHAE